MSRRPKMLASVVREIIAPVLRECPRTCGVVAITEVDVSGDFSYATVYISALHHPGVALKFLEGRRPHLTTALGELRRRRIPELRFRIDPRTQQGEKIDDLLASL